MATLNQAYMVRCPKCKASPRHPCTYTTAMIYARKPERGEKTKLIPNPQYGKPTKHPHNERLHNADITRWRKVNRRDPFVRISEEQREVKAAQQEWVRQENNRLKAWLKLYGRIFTEIQTNYYEATYNQQEIT